MSPFAVALDEFDIEEPTQVEDTGKWKPTAAKRYPGDDLIEHIDLKSPGGNVVQVRGSGAVDEANKVLQTWAAALPRFFGRRPGDGLISMGVRFGSGITYTGRLDLRNKAHRNVIGYMNDVEHFRESFCPELPPQDAEGVFEVFRSLYRFSAVG